MSEDSFVVPYEERYIVVAGADFTIVVPAEWRVILVLEEASGQ